MNRNIKISWITACLTVPLVLATVVLSCKKEAKKTAANPESVISGVNNAKQYFTAFIDSENSTEKGTGGKSAVYVAEAKQRLQAFAQQVDWGRSMSKTINSVDYTIVPVAGSLTPFNNKSYEFLRALVFTDQSGHIQMKIVEILGDKGTSLMQNHAELIASSIENLFSEKTKTIPSTNASVMLYDNNYRQEKSFHITNGTWEERRIIFRSDLNITQ